MLRTSLIVGAGLMFSACGFSCNLLAQDATIIAHDQYVNSTAGAGIITSGDRIKIKATVKLDNLQQMVESNFWVRIRIYNDEGQIVSTVTHYPTVPAEQAPELEFSGAAYLIPNPQYSSFYSGEVTVGTGNDPDNLASRTGVVDSMCWTP